MTTLSIIAFILIILVLGALINTLATGLVRLIAFAVLGVLATLLLSNALRNPSANIALPRIPNIFRTSQQPADQAAPAAVGGDSTTPAGQSPVQQAPAVTDAGGPAFSTGDTVPPDPTLQQPQPAPTTLPERAPVRGLW